MTYKVGKYEYREFCSDFILINESLINADSPKEAVNIWMEKDVKILAIKEVTKEHYIIYVAKFSKPRKKIYCKDRR